MTNLALITLTTILYAQAAATLLLTLWHALAQLNAAADVWERELFWEGE